MSLTQTTTYDCICSFGKLIEATMNNWIPDQLFRYRPVSGKYFEQELKELNKNKVWLNFLDVQNDPFEGVLSPRPYTIDQFRKEYHIRKKDLVEFTGDDNILPQDVSDQQIAECNAHTPIFAEKLRKEAVIASFSKTAHSTLMWGHYAEEFKGICLCFEAKSVSVAPDGPPFVQVQYWQGQPPTFSSLEFFIQTRISDYVGKKTLVSPVRESLQDIAHEKIKLAMISKSSEWVYEDEFRMLSIGGVPGYFPVPGANLSHVIFGPRCESKTYHQVISILGDTVGYSKMGLQPSSYGYSPEPVSPHIVKDIISG